MATSGDSHLTHPPENRVRCDMWRPLMKNPDPKVCLQASSTARQQFHRPTTSSRDIRRAIQGEAIGALVT